MVGRGSLLLWEGHTPSKNAKRDRFTGPAATSLFRHHTPTNASVMHRRLTMSTAKPAPSMRRATHRVKAPSGKAQERLRNRYAKGLRGLGVDHQLELRAVDSGTSRPRGAVATGLWRTPTDGAAPILAMTSSASVCANFHRMFEKCNAGLSPRSHLCEFCPPHKQPEHGEQSRR
jgi:hypothetical protein